MNIPDFDKVYVGDGIYIRGAQGYLEITTENGIEQTNIIYMEGQYLETIVLILKAKGVKLP